ncbi:MAG: polysaccharide deacetylase family protein, partial [Atopobiaceae bacterium]|nr:polysaccharide deacetylase family protein [Atopobiaceae bacterium]
MEERRDNERGRGASRMSRRIRWGIRVLVALGLAALCLGSVLFVEQRLGKTHTIPDEVFDPRQSENPVMDAATIDGVGGEVQTSGNSGEPADLKWRDTDFAVDPARTEWNYESNGRKVVYLTIDDGPSENTIEVLDILDRYGCKATFFVT